MMNFAFVKHYLRFSGSRGIPRTAHTDPHPSNDPTSPKNIPAPDAPPVIPQVSRYVSICGFLWQRDKTAEFRNVTTPIAKIGQNS